ncbi:hypothetical protein COTS27_01156 [Spirochaetota bacterium]|nr:hypothetical protein COTS27_01156 [Spirochaetota bacterium]
MYPQKLYYKFKLLLKQPQQRRRISRLLNTLKLAAFFIGGLAVVLLTVFIVWINQPTHLAFTPSRVYTLSYDAITTLPIGTDSNANSLTRNKTLSSSSSQSPPSTAPVIPQAASSSVLFDYHNDTIALLVKQTTPKLIISNSVAERVLMPERFTQNAQAMRLHNSHLVLVLSNSPSQAANEPLKISMAYLNIDNDPAAPFVRIHTNFLLPYSHQAWQTMLPEITLRTYDQNKFTLRLAKETLISFNDTGHAEWIHIGALVRPLLTAKQMHFETVLTAEHNKVYIILADYDNKPYRFTMLLYDLEQNKTINRYHTNLSDPSYFTINDHHRLITISFVKEINQMQFKIKPLEKISFLSDLFNFDVSNNTLIKTLTFANNQYPQNLRFNDNRFIGFYQTAEAIEFWNWY